jgi:DNA-directed RNA polymerase
MCKPRKWKKNTGGGYFSENHSIILGSGNYHKLNQDYECLNILQDMRWEINQEVAENVRNTNKIQMTVGKKQFKGILKEYKDKTFHFVYKYDKRGRVYSSGYDLNIQGDEYHKALLDPAKGSKVNAEGINGLKIAVAGYAGLDKLTWQERIDWFDVTVEKDPDFRDIEWDKPILGPKAVRAYKDAIADKEVKFLMELDATSSGIQLMSVLSGCKISAKTCNLVRTGKREDIYTFLVDKMNKKLVGKDLVNRKKIKKPLMTKFYNSEAVPKKSFNRRQLKAFNEALDGMLPGVMDVMDVINQCWQYDQDYHEWTLPDGHVAHIKVTEMCDARIRIKELDNSKIRYRYNKQQCSENFRSLVPNVIHSIDAYALREVVKRAHQDGFEVACIHDCFLVHQNNWQKICQLYREVLAEIADSNLLQNILSEITGIDIELEKDSNDLSEYILNSEYALS